MEEAENGDRQERDQERNNGLLGLGNLTEADMRAIMEVRNESLIEQIESL